MEKEHLIENTPLSHQTIQSKSETSHVFEIENKVDTPIATKTKTKSKTNEPTTIFGKLMSAASRFYMLWMLVIVVPLAAIGQWGHNEGPLHPQISSSWVMTTCLFFGIGLLIKIEYLQRAVYFWQMIIFAHLIIFVYWPVVGWSIYQIVELIPGISDTLLTLFNGIIILTCLPATASSATVFTMNVDGNEAASAVNCTLCNLIAIFLTPALILLFTGSETSIDAANIFTNLSLRVVAPFIVAQCIRCGVGKRGRKKITKYKPYVKKFNETAILYMVFCALSESFYVGIDATTTDAIVFLVFIQLLHIHSYFMIYFFGKIFENYILADNQATFTIKDNIAIVYTGVSKSIAMGVPFIEMIYADDPNVGIYLLPILCYHPSNLIWGSIFSEPMRSLIEKNIANYSELMLSMMQTTNTTMPFLDPDWSPDPPQIENISSNDHTQNGDYYNYGAMEAITPMAKNSTDIITPMATHIKNGNTAV